MLITRVMTQIIPQSKVFARWCWRNLPARGRCPAVAQRYPQGPFYTEDENIKKQQNLHAGFVHFRAVTLYACLYIYPSIGPPEADQVWSLAHALTHAHTRTRTKPCSASVVERKSKYTSDHHSIYHSPIIILHTIFCLFLSLTARELMRCRVLHQFEYSTSNMRFPIQKNNKK